MNDFDKYLHDTIQGDQLHFDVDPSLAHRLRNHMNFIAVRSKPGLNSILSLKLKELRPLNGIKVGIACLLFFAFFGYKQINSFSGVFLEKDTTQITIAIDTSTFPISDTVVHTN